MKRASFRMKIKPGFAAEYKKRHDEIWPELKVLLKNAGVSEYSIFLDEETSTLYAFQKVSSSQGSQDLGSNPLVQKWWHYMADIMDVNEDESPVSVELTEVFFME